MVYFLPILGGQKAAVSDSVEGWCAAGNLGASKVSTRMDDRTDGQRDDETDRRRDEFRGSFISSLGGQKAAVSNSVEGWCAAGNLGASRVSIRMDDRTDGQRDDGMDSGKASFHPDVL